MPFLRTLDASVAAVNQGGRRKGAACVYLETWHADIEEFLELRDNTGEEARRTHNLNLAHWIPDEFMRRVEADADWSLFSPADVPELVDLWGDEFDAAYRRAEAAGLAVRQIPARQLYARMMRTLAQTGNGWMTFKDASNRTANQTAEPGSVVHSSNLCTEILEVTDDGETAVCNLGSVNLAAHLAATDGPLEEAMDWERLDATVRTAVTFLDRVVDINFYPTGPGRHLQLPLAAGGPGRDGAAGRLLPAAAAVRLRAGPAAVHPDRGARSCWPPTRRPATWPSGTARCPPGPRTRAARGVLHPDHYEVDPAAGPSAGTALRARMAATGLRNALLLAIAPTATIASIAGGYECIEPQVSNLFKRETLSGEFLQVNSYLVADLKALGRVGRGRPATRCASPTARCRSSTGSRARSGRSTAPPGSCRSAR